MNYILKRLYTFFASPFIGYDGNLSVRRVLAIVFAVIEYQYITHKENPDYKVLLVLGLTIFLLLGMITVQNIVEISKGSKIIEKIADKTID